MSSDDHIKLQARSIKKWKHKIIQYGCHNYSKKTHMDWVDTSNDGVSHFGLEANLFPLENISRFDTFHLRSAITCQFISSLRTFMFLQIFECQKEFEALISTIWNSYYVFMWKDNKPFSSLRGTHILSFINLIPDVVKFLQCKFVETKVLKNLCGGLDLWMEICHFIHRTKIEDAEAYEDDILEFKRQLKMFYVHGSHYCFPRRVLEIKKQCICMFYVFISLKLLMILGIGSS